MEDKKVRVNKTQKRGDATIFLSSWRAEPKKAKGGEPPKKRSLFVKVGGDNSPASQRSNLIKNKTNEEELRPTKPGEEKIKNVGGGTCLVEKRKQRI